MLVMQSSQFKFVKIHSLLLKIIKVFFKIMKFNINHQKKIAALYQANTFNTSASSFLCCSYEEEKEEKEEEEEEEEKEEEECVNTGKSLTKRRFSSSRK
jgi:hypothetical protein